MTGAPWRPKNPGFTVARRHGDYKFRDSDGARPAGEVQVRAAITCDSFQVPLLHGLMEGRLRRPRPEIVALLVRAERGEISNGQAAVQAGVDPATIASWRVQLAQGELLVGGSGQGAASEPAVAARPVRAGHAASSQRSLRIPRALPSGSRGGNGISAKLSSHGYPRTTSLESLEPLERALRNGKPAYPGTESEAESALRALLAETASLRAENKQLKAALKETRALLLELLTRTAR